MIIKRGGALSDNFTSISNFVLKDKKLSIEARFALCYICSLPRNWTIVKEHLQSEFNIGRDRLNSILKELKTHGYLIAVQLKKDGKFIANQYEVNQMPFKSNTENTFSDYNEVTENPHYEHSPYTENAYTVEPSTVNPQLINTNSKKKEVKNDSFLFSNENKKGAKKKKVDKPKADEGEKSELYQNLVDSYFIFYKHHNAGVPPNFTAADGKALKNLIPYLKTIAENKATEKNMFLDAAALDQKALESWQHIFKNWAKLDGFLQGKMRIVDIQSNISNIITQIKNGHSKTTKQPTGKDVTDADIIRTVASMYPSNG